MANLNTLACLTNAGNTGIGACYLDFKQIIGAIIAPKNYEFDVTTPQATLSAACLNASKTLRLYPIWDLESITDASEAKIIQSLGTGAKHPVREGFNDWSFQYVQGGLSLLQNLRKFNGDAWDYYFVDANNKIMGIPGSTTTKLKAIPSKGGFFWANPWKPNDGSKITEYLIQFSFNQKYGTDLVGYVEPGFDLPTTLYGLQDTVLTGVGSATPGTYNITAKTASIGQNLGDLYPTALASNSMWAATCTETGAVVPITGVTYDAVNKFFVVVCTVTSPPYPGAGQHISINLVAPATLDAAGVTGIESTGAVSIAKN